MMERTGSRWLGVVVAVTLCAGPTTARAAPAGSGDVAGFEAGFQAGQAQYDAGEFLAAARTWKEAAGKLPQTAEHRVNRAAIHDYMAEAYEKSQAEAADEAVLREALAVLDEYATRYAAAFPGEAVSPKLAGAQERLRGRLNEIEAAKRPAVEEPSVVEKAPKVEPVKPKGKPWLGLAVGGGVALAGGAAMLGMFAVGYTRTNKFEDEIEAPELGCQAGMLTGACATLHDQGKSANSVAVAGLVLAPVLLLAGAAMVGVAVKRKRAVSHAFAPQVGRGLVGAHWQWRF